MSNRPAELPADDPVIGRVRALLELAAQHRLAELTIETGDFKLSLRTGGHAAGAAVSAGAPAPAGPVPDEPPAEESLILTAPMIGTFYVAPAPGEPPFVSIGERIEVGQTVAIIEAMKIMNEIQADKAGVLVELLAHNGQGVEFGQPLFRLRP